MRVLTFAPSPSLPRVQSFIYLLALSRLRDII